MLISMNLNSQHSKYAEIFIFFHIHDLKDFKELRFHRCNGTSFMEILNNTTNRKTGIIKFQFCTIIIHAQGFQGRFSQPNTIRQRLGSLADYLKPQYIKGRLRTVDYIKFQFCSVLKDTENRRSQRHWVKLKPTYIFNTRQ